MSLRKDGARQADRARPFDRILVANRGEIAVRVIRACRELGIDSVAVYSDADADALHCRLADASVHIGPAPAAESYLRVEAIIEAARSSGAQAIHPGYGFLSEQPALARACEASGITFIGPAPQTLAELGDKLSARRRAADAGVPVVPGIFEPIALDHDGGAEKLRGAARSIGYPLLVKAAAGGGGRGMRRVDEAAALIESVSAAAREALAAFGDGSVYLERYVERARHVEVQLLGDSHGEVLALGERDCSVQRRHQKLIEEAPAPWLTREQRVRLHELGVEVARTVGLRNAATAEFLLTDDGDFWFLEVNARLQVEHGVTELVADVDLVQEQIRIAAGQPISQRARRAAERAADPVRHAFEVRLTAEDPAADFLPGPGRLTTWQPPAGPGVRVDAGVEQGGVIAAEYDSLFAKLMVVAADREAALSRLDRALSETRIAGVQSTLPFFRWLLRQEAFRDATRLSTDLVAREWQPADIVGRAGLRAAELAARAAAATPPRSARPAADTTRDGTAAEAWWSLGMREALDQGVS